MLTNPKKDNYDEINQDKGKIIEFPETNKFEADKAEADKKEEITFKESEVIIKNSSKEENKPYFFKNEKKSQEGNILNFEKRNGNGNNLPPKPTIIAILGIAIMIFAIWGFTNKNSQEIFIGKTSIGIIQDKEITVEEIENTVIAKLQEELGTNVKLNEEIILKPVHASSKDIVSTEYILTEIGQKCTFEVEAACIVIDGEEKVVVKNEEEAKAVLYTLASKYITEGATLVSEPTFVQNVEIVGKFIEQDDIMNSDTAISLLDVNSEQGKKYEIQAGDTLYQIAINADMTMEELLALNPDLTEDSILKIGQEINLIVPVPLLSVIIEEEVVYTESIPKIIETIDNNEEYMTYREVITEGSDGSKEVTAKITKINGLEESREVISETVLVEPTVEKVEVGTLTTPPKKALGSFIYPVSGARLSSGYGMRWGTLHAGIDLACSAGTPIKASDGGTVVFAGWNDGGYGYMVKIDHGNGFQTVYAHNSSNVVTVGQKVAQGEVIAYVGSTGNSTGNHVHFEIIKNGTKVDPMSYLQ